LVILEEYTMLPPNNMYMLIKAWKEFGFQVICFGDPDQCPAPVDDWIAYDKNPLFLEMCGHTVIELHYKDGFSRYDKELHSALLELRKTGKLSAWKNQGPVPTVYKHIVFTNSLRDKLNIECFDRWVSEKHVDVVRIKNFSACIGLHVMVYHGNDHEHGMYKTQEWIITNINTESEKESVTVKKGGTVVTLGWDRFCELFDYSFAVTAHKCQGITIKEDFVVHQTNRMPWEVAYTAVSRGTALSKVHIDNLPIGKIDRAFRPLSIVIERL
jgi:hypothetical protein